jgi:hypothetical protein
MKSHYPLLLTSALLLAGGSSQAAEITPFIGYRAGGEITDTVAETRHDIKNTSMFGLIIGSDDFDMGKKYELYYSHQATDIKSVNINSLPLTYSSNNIPLTIDYLHAGGTTPISEHNNIKTFMSGGLGMTYLSPDINGLDSELRASFSIGIGMKWPLAKQLSLRLEGRGLATLFNNNASIFCSGGCTFSISGNFFTQYEAFAGLAYEF